MVALSLAATAHAWDAGTTHAGLTEGAALQSRVGQVLAEVYGRPLALWEPLALALDGGERGERILARLAKLDPGNGYAPADGRLPAISWIVAGSVAEEAPPGRDRNHFFDPTTGRGLDQGGLLAGADLRLAGALDGSGSLRGLFTGASFDGTGRASTAWLTADDNDFSLGRFLDARERATAAATPEEREHALAEALLTAGALLHVVEDAAEPAHARDDFRVAFAERGARLIRFTVDKYGRVAVPAPAGPAQPLAHLADAIHDRAGDGLADRTARALFSDGTLPGSTGAPALPRVEPHGDEGYVAGPGVAHLAHFRRAGDGTVRWDLDARCLADYAAAQLPLAGQGALSALDHLFRGGLSLQAGAIAPRDLALGAGTLRVFVEEAGGKRRLLAERKVTAAQPGQPLVELGSDTPPSLAAVFRGVDVNGEPIVVAGRFTGAR